MLSPAPRARYHLLPWWAVRPRRRWLPTLPPPLSRTPRFTLPNGTSLRASLAPVGIRFTTASLGTQMWWQSTLAVVGRTWSGFVCECCVPLPQPRRGVCGCTVCISPKRWSNIVTSRGHRWATKNTPSKKKIYTQPNTKKKIAAGFRRKI